MSINTSTISTHEIQYIFLFRKNKNVYKKQKTKKQHLKIINQKNTYQT